MQTVKNAVGREIPLELPGIEKMIPFKGAFELIPQGRKEAPLLTLTPPGKNKLLKDLEAAIDAVGLKDGMTISFHHHLRNGDFILNQILEILSRRGIKDITLASTSLFPTHAGIVDHIKNGVITGMQSGLHGKIGRAVSDGLLQKPVITRSHGGRARAIEAGDLKIDVAFLTAPTADAYGNANGVYGPSACGALGYPQTDANYANKVVVITDNLVEYPASPISIDQTKVDFVVAVERIGDPKGIVSGPPRTPPSPVAPLIAQNAVKLMVVSGLVRNGFSFQTGAGGASLAAAAYLRDYLKKNGIVGGFCSGGITAYLVQLLKEGLFKKLMDVQCFDLEAVASLRDNPNHIEMSGSMYGNPHNKGAVVNMLDIVILGATEIDLDFNVNVAVESDGSLVHAIGGHMDTAAGAKLTIITAPLIRGRLCTVLDRVLTVTTPGETIDALVTERGIAINPRRKDLIERAKAAGLPIATIEELQAIAEKITGKPKAVEFEDQIVGVIEYRDGSIIDVVRKPIR